MIEQLKFKGKPIFGEGWRVGYYVYDDNCDRAYIYQNRTGGMYTGCVAIEVIPDTVGLFTGERDRYGGDIYSGDIVRVGAKIMRVIFKNGCFYTPYKKCRYRLAGWDKDLIAIIGNISENPEVLNEEPVAQECDATKLNSTQNSETKTF